ncbi:MAG TPA: SUF system NifU family Fe-S cluster assembly protein [Deinococcales bacterium]|nr:SUF system NifU family Fe-S cluster assembly protein [Deinococcales bacterium]
MGFLEDMYRQVILEHYKSPRNKGHLDAPTVAQGGHNPSCGDMLELELLVKDGRVEDVRFDGHGCAVSQASASLLTEAVKGKTVAESLELAHLFEAMVRGAEPDPRLGDVTALQGVAKLPARVKCATLAWQTLEVACEGLAERAD